MMKLILPMMALLMTPLWAHSIHFLSLTPLLLMSMIPLTLTPTSLSNLITLDSLNLPLLMLTAWITSLMLMASFPISQSKAAPNMFKQLCILLLIFLTLAFSTNNLLMFYISFEASLIPTLFLILKWGYQPERLQASMYMMMYTICASLPLLLGIMFLNQSLESLNMMLNHTAISMQTPKIWWLVLMTAFMVKIPMYGTHLWLPKAHVEAPVAGSMILAAILLKLGSYGLLRMASILMPMNASMTTPIMSISLVGAVATGLTCLRQPDLKALIAYSSVAHMGLLTAGSMTNSNWGWEGSLGMMLAHGLCSSALFSLANTSYETTQTRSLLLTKGMLTLFPSLSTWWFLSSAANLGAPPSMNLLSEIILITSILSLSNLFGALLALATFMAAAYSLILFTSTQHGPVPKFTNPLNTYNHRNHLLMILHIFPLFILIMKSSLIISWL